MAATEASPAELPGFLQSAERIVFLGDSITDAGHYISQVELQWRLRHDGKAPEMINLGLPSETCSGLSEPDHPFPRPNVHERLRRALVQAQPDVIVACYGMNDGIYYPFSNDRFAAYKQGVEKLIDEVSSSGVRLILMTPPPFDPLPFRRQGKLLPAGADKYAWFSIYEEYDEVMRRYSDWVLAKDGQVDLTVNLRQPVLDHLHEQRKTQPGYVLSSDGVHLNVAGHEILAATILRAWGFPELSPVPSGLLKLVERRQRLLHAAWVSHVGHKRPQVKPGLQLEEAQARASKIEAKIISRMRSN